MVCRSFLVVFYTSDSLCCTCSFCQVVAGSQVTKLHVQECRVGSWVKLTSRANLDCLRGSRIVHAKHQPANHKRLLTRTNTFRKPRSGVKKCGRKRCGLCTHGHLLGWGESITLKNGETITSNRLITCDSTKIVYCIICPECSEFYIGGCKTLRARMNLHRNH